MNDTFGEPVPCTRRVPPIGVLGVWYDEFLMEFGH
jgi:hypothetical protein